MKIKGSTKLIGILGNPIEHSLSPIMHNRAFDEYKLDFAYIPLKVAPNSLKEAVEGLRAMNFAGANVTIPYKENIIPYLDEISEESKTIGAVNTIVNKEGRLYGTTTDPIGFKKGFFEKAYEFKNKSLAILGTGGAARTIAFALTMPYEASEITLIGRNSQRLDQLKQELFRQSGVKIKTQLFENYKSHSKGYDVLIQTTSVGMYPDTDNSILKLEDLHPAQIVYDIIYNPIETKLMQMAKSKGCEALNGLGMLVHQGVEAFKIWTHVSPDPQIFYDSLRENLKII